MYRLGHTGIALLVLAPLSYILLEANKPILALITGLTVMWIEPLPDSDFRVSFLDHRGVSHSLVAALAIGGAIALCGWFVTEPVIDTLAPLLAELSTYAAYGASVLESFEGTGAIGWVTVFLADTLRWIAESLEWLGEQVGILNRWMVAIYGFAVGVIGIIVHLLGDVITVSGIRPFLPFSRWQLSLSSLRADSTLANYGLLVLGVVAIVVVLVVTGPSIGFAALPADLSPVGVAAGQTATQTPNQTTNTSGASVVVSNQTTNGSTITIQKVVLPKNGFVGIHTSEYIGGPAPAEYSVIAVSNHLPSGVHRNVTIDISNAPPGNPPGLNQTQLNRSQTLRAVIYRDTDDDHQFDFVSTYGETDSAFTYNNGSVVHDSARIRVPVPKPQTASVVFRNQSLQNNTLTVAKAHLPKGGFLVALNESYQQTGDPLTSAVGISQYLPPGSHQNVTLRVLPGTLNRSQIVTIIPAQDTNGNQQYDYIRSDGFQDIAYETANRSAIVQDAALVRVPGTQRTTATVSPTATPTPTPTQTTTRSPTTAASRGEAGGSGGLFGGLGIGVILAILVVAIALVLVARRLR